MNRTVWLARLLRVGGVLEAGVGLVLLVDPAMVARLLLRSSLEGPGPAIARIAGGGLLGLGIACWCARATPTAPASVGVAWGLLEYNVAACVILVAEGPALANGGFAALLAAVLHGVLGVALLLAFLGGGRS